MAVVLDQLNETFGLKDGGYSVSNDSCSQPRHRWYILKEAFSPALVKAALKECQADKCAVVLDPFSGSGTTAVAVAEHGADCVGVEVNPFLAFVARTKLTRCRFRTLFRCLPAMRNGIGVGRKSPLEGMSTFCEGGSLAKWLFNRDVLRGFEGGWRAASEAPRVARGIAKLCLIGAALDVCNAYKDGKCLRYRRDWEKKSFTRRDFRDAFDERVDAVLADLETAPKLPGNAHILLGDCRQILGGAAVRKFSLCVTSPPYLNSFDYSDIYRPELFLGRFVSSNQALRRVRLRTMRSHVQADWEKPASDLDLGGLLDEAMISINGRAAQLWDKRLPSMVRAYFEDWNVILAALKRRAKQRAALWIVVSTSAYAGVEVPVDLILAEIATRNGWLLREIGVLRHLRSAGQHWHRVDARGAKGPRLRESVVILELPKK